MNKKELEEILDSVLEKCKDALYSGVYYDMNNYIKDVFVDPRVIQYLKLRSPLTIEEVRKNWTVNEVWVKENTLGFVYQYQGIDEEDRLIFYKPETGDRYYMYVENINLYHTLIPGQVDEPYT